jgi:hypothetical protein
MRATLRHLILAAALVLTAAAAADTSPHQFPPATPSGLPQAAADLRQGIAKISSPGIPGTLAVWGPSAEVLITARADGGVEVPLVAISTLGRGHIAALTHSSYASDGSMEADTASLLISLSRWCSRTMTTPTIEQPLLGVNIATNNDSLAKWLASRGASVKPIDEKQLDADAKAQAQGFFLPAPSDVGLIIYSGTPSLAHARLFADAAKLGQGLIVAQTGWGWQQLSNDAPMRTNPWNIALADAGIAWTSEYADDTAPDAFLVTNPSPLSHGTRALAFFKDRQTNPPASKPTREEASQLRQASRSLMDMARFAQDPATLAALNEVETAVADRIPTESNPIRAHEGLVRMSLARVVANDIENAASADPNTIKAHPASKAFPGEVPPDAPRIAATAIINLSTPAWHSTAMYAPPGEVITLTVTPTDAAAKRALEKGRVAVRVGCHTDQLWHKSDWQRVPSISLRIPLREGANRLATPFGGTLYIDVDNNTKGDLRVDALGVVAAPLFVRGKTSLQDWRDHIRSAPGPWAELATDKVILSVPSSSIRDLDDPESLMALWDQILDNAADLAMIPHERTRPERYAADLQISAGYMHSGYPIMVPLEAAADMVSVDRLRDGTWGLFHELGHNHQSSAWTFDGTVEVTVNLFSLYLMETVCNKPVAEGHDALADRNKNMARHLAMGAPFDKWKSDPFLALTMYIQLREAFGWEPFKQAFAAYQEIPGPKRPKSEEQKRDMWLVQMSTTTGKNLGPFFQAWGIPTSDAARTSVSHLPGWMPEGLAAPAK